MNGRGFQICGRSVILFVAVALSAFRTIAQQPPNLSDPPTSFSAEDAKFPDAVSLPDCVRRLLASEEHVANTLEYAHLSPEQLPADWFTASEQELKPSNGAYLVVMGAGLMRGANINPFWIFRQSAKSCELVLSVGVHDLKVLKTKTNGLPDIKTAAATAVRYFENQYKFDGHTYQLARRASQPIEEELPNDLSAFKRRKVLEQRIWQSPEPVLSEARSWLWRQWWLEKPSYLTVTLHSKEGDKTTITYLIRQVGSQLQMMIQTHKILVDRASAGHSMVEDELVVALDVERRFALKDNPDRTREVPEHQEMSPDLYELYFSDEAGDNLAIL
jgi:hypothetical protein